MDGMGALYCRICGQPHDIHPDLRGAPHMPWWAFRYLVTGQGCPVCSGNVPAWITKLSQADEDHILDGFEIQWEENVRKHWKKHLPFPGFPEPEDDKHFCWAEPTLARRLHLHGKASLQAVNKIEGGPDSLRVHPDHLDSTDAAEQYGLWHPIASESADFAADTSSVRAINALVVRDLFGAQCQKVGSQLWILVGMDVEGNLTIDLTTLARLTEVEAALRKYHAITAEVCKNLDVKSRRAG